MAASALRKRQFIDTTFELLGNTLAASRLVYYSVDPEQNLYDFVCMRTPADFIRSYVREMHAVDPLHVRRISSPDERVARMDIAVRHTPAQHISEYRRFLQHFDVVENIDLIFRHDDEIKAGLSVMWTSSDPRPTQVQFALADQLHRYIEFNLAGYLAPPRPDLERRAVQLFHLTRREAEVAKLLCCGRTNADIAACLGIGLATVKTHLIHIFEKTGVENRSGLVARLSAPH
jgi:DNA-binding CsgD family transcriptional regulator